MHDSHVHGSCGDCDRFVTPFPTERAFSDWGYCAEQNQAPDTVGMAHLHSSVLAGDRAALRQNDFGLYRSEPEDACDFFRHRE